MADPILNVTGNADLGEISVAFADLERSLASFKSALNGNKQELNDFATMLKNVANGATAFQNTFDTLGSSLENVSEKFSASTLIEYNRELYKLALASGQTDKSFADFEKTISGMSQRLGYSRSTIVDWGRSFQGSAGFVGKSISELEPMMAKLSAAFMSPAEISEGSKALQQYAGSLSKVAKEGMLAGKDVTGFMQALMSGDIAAADKIQQYMTSSGGALSGTKASKRSLEGKEVKKEEAGKEATLRLAEAMEPLTGAVIDLNANLKGLMIELPALFALGRMGQASGNIGAVGDSINSGLDLIKGTKLGGKLEGFLTGGGKGALGKLGGLAGSLLGRGAGAAGGAAGAVEAGTGVIGSALGGGPIGPAVIEAGVGTLTKTIGSAMPLIGKGLGLAAKALPIVGNIMMGSDIANWLGHKTGILPENWDISLSSLLGKAVSGGIKAIGGIFGKKDEEKRKAAAEADAPMNALFASLRKSAEKITEINASLTGATAKKALVTGQTTGVLTALGAGEGIAGREAIRAQIPQQEEIVKLAQERVDKQQEMNAEIEAAGKKLEPELVAQLMKGKQELLESKNELIGMNMAIKEFQKSWQQIRIEKMAPGIESAIGMTTGNVRETLAVHQAAAQAAVMGAQQNMATLEGRMAKTKEEMSKNPNFTEDTINQRLQNMQTEASQNLLEANNKLLANKIEYANTTQKVAGIDAAEFERRKSLFELEQKRSTILPTMLGVQMAFARQGMENTNSQLLAQQQLLANIPKFLTGQEAIIATYKVQAQIGALKNEQAQKYMELTGGLVGQIEDALGQLDDMDKDVNDFMPRLAEVGSMIRAQGFEDLAPMWKSGSSAGEGGPRQQPRTRRELIEAGLLSPINRASGDNALMAGIDQNNSGASPNGGAMNFGGNSLEGFGSGYSGVGDEGVSSGTSSLSGGESAGISGGVGDGSLGVTGDNNTINFNGGIGGTLGELGDLVNSGFADTSASAGAVFNGYTGAGSVGEAGINGGGGAVSYPGYHAEGGVWVKDAPKKEKTVYSSKTMGLRANYFEDLRRLSEANIDSDNPAMGGWMAGMHGKELKGNAQKNLKAWRASQKYDETQGSNVGQPTNTLSTKLTGRADQTAFNNVINGNGQPGNSTKSDQEQEVLNLLGKIAQNTGKGGSQLSFPQ